MTALLSPVARQLFLNPADGTPASGYKIFTYFAGTTTKQNTFTDSTGGTPNTNPIILDSLGECDLWLTPNSGYKFVFSPPTDTDPPTNAIWTRDNIFGSPLIAPISPWAIAGGTSDAITATYSPPNTSLPDGLLLGVRFGAANATSTPTFKPDAQPTYVITDFGGQPLAIGAIAGAGAEGLLRFNLANTRWELLNPAVVSGPGGSTTQLVPAVNARMSVTAASFSAAFTADYVSPALSLGGTVYPLASFSQTINLSTTGAGGMDTGSPPASGFVSLYAIYDPATLTASILACNATTSTSTIYAGANLPAGYTASELIGVWPTDGSGKFQAGIQNGRTVSYGNTVFNSFTVDGAYHSLSIATAVPPNAKLIGGFLSVTGSATTNNLASSTGGIGEILAGGPAITPFSNLSIITAQTMAYKFAVGGTPVLFIGTYTF